MPASGTGGGGALLRQDDDVHTACRTLGGDRRQRPSGVVGQRRPGQQYQQPPGLGPRQAGGFSLPQRGEPAAEPVDRDPPHLRGKLREHAFQAGSGGQGGAGDAGGPQRGETCKPGPQLIRVVDDDPHRPGRRRREHPGEQAAHNADPLTPAVTVHHDAQVAAVEQADGEGNLGGDSAGQQRWDDHSPHPPQAWPVVPFRGSLHGYARC